MVRVTGETKRTIDVGVVLNVYHTLTWQIMIALVQYDRSVRVI